MKYITGAMLILLPAASLAAGPLDGTWKGDMSTAVYSGNPDSYEVGAGQFSCSSCAPPLAIPADGKPHPVTGHDYYDVATATVASPSLVKVTTSLKGTTVRESTYTVAPDGKSMKEVDTDYDGPSPSTTTWVFKRVKDGASGAHPLSGGWLPDPKHGNDSTPPTLVYRQTADELKFSTPLSNVTYDARFDGKEYPLANDAAGGTVVLEKLGPRKIRSSHKARGQVTGVYTMEVSDDGKIMHMVSEDRTTHQTMEFDLKKQ